MFFLAFIGSVNSYAKESHQLPPLLKEVETLYSKSATLSANFQQTTDSITLAKKKKSFGKIFFKRPSKVRWETQKPDASLFISNGQQSWFYTPPFEEGEKGQVIEKKSSEVQSQLASALLAGSFSVAKQMKIQKKTESQFVLIPKSGTAGTVTKATLDIDPTQKLIKKVTLDHKGGNQTEITLDQIQLAIPLSDDLFNFKIPPNTEKVDPELE